mmetsp:Transcript_15784/g.51548  ORF Transcript_15784/g.51548 Transcript_15784/m.51548 type:complete len:108 (+) Transcript_15784:200-523(+)
MVQQQHGLALQGGIISSADRAACTSGHRGCRAGGGGRYQRRRWQRRCDHRCLNRAAPSPTAVAPVQPGGAQGDCNFGRACGGAHARDKGNCAWRGVHSKMSMWEAMP